MKPTGAGGDQADRMKQAATSTTKTKKRGQLIEPGMTDLSPGGGPRTKSLGPRRLDSPTSLILGSKREGLG